MVIDDIKPRLRRRFEFIEFQLLWAGRVGRKSLLDQFGISPQQATLDLTAYLDTVPENMKYDHRRRAYVPMANFKPVFAGLDASAFLMHLEMLHQGYQTEDEIWPAIIPEFDLVKETARPISPKVLKTLLKAIKHNLIVKAEYVSLSSETKTIRSFAPHAIAGDGHRWHMRAFDYEKNHHSDFVLSRIESLTLLEEKAEDVTEDRAWNTFINLRIQPDPKLNERQRRRLAYEYSMEDGELKKDIRQAMLFYYLRYFGFDPREIVDGKMRNKSSYNLHIVNLDEVEVWLDRR